MEGLSALALKGAFGLDRVFALCRGARGDVWQGLCALVF